MKTHIFVDNIKSGGCASTITKKVSAIENISNVEVDISSGKVSFICEDDTCRLDVISTLKKWGYPQSGTVKNWIMPSLSLFV
ncbi:MAG: copper chaperone [Saprospiraceae bacterium]|jgi:copper chaperone CopZ